MKNFSHHSNSNFVLTGLLILISLFAAHGQVELSQTDQPKFNPWLANLYEIGVTVKGDSLVISDEAKQVAINPDLRKIIYPAVYSWQQAQALLVQMQIKVGVWYMINLYAEGGENKNAILQYILALDRKVDMEKVLVSSFYTYIFFDPQASTMKDGKPEILHPEILENKLAVINELSRYVQAARNME